VDLVHHCTAGRKRRGAVSAHHTEGKREVGSAKNAHDAERYGEAPDVRSRTHAPGRIGVVDGGIQVFTLDDFFHEQPKLENGPPQLEAEPALVKMCLLLTQGNQFIGIGFQGSGNFRQPVSPPARGDLLGLLIGIVSGCDLIVCLLECCDHGSIPSGACGPLDRLLWAKYQASA
jgi:hypothetical protein